MGVLALQFQPRRERALYRPITRVGSPADVNGNHRLLQSRNFQFLPKTPGCKAKESAEDLWGFLVCLCGDVNG